MKRLRILLFLLPVLPAYALEPGGLTKIEHRLPALKNPVFLERFDMEKTPGLFGSALSGENGKFRTFSIRNYRYWKHTKINFYLKPGPPERAYEILNLPSLRFTLENNRVLAEIRHDALPPGVLKTNRPLKPGGWHRITFDFGNFIPGGLPPSYHLYIDGCLAAALPVYAPPSGVPDGFLRVRAPRNGLLDHLSISRESELRFDDVKRLDLKPDFSSGWTGVYRDADFKNGILTLKTGEIATEEVLSNFFSVEPEHSYRLTWEARIPRFDAGVCALGIWVRYYFEPEETCSYGGDMLFQQMDPGKTFDWKTCSANFRVPRGKRDAKRLGYARIQVKIYRAAATGQVKSFQLEKIGR